MKTLVCLRRKITVMLLCVTLCGVIRVMLSLIVRQWGHRGDVKYMGFFGSGGEVVS